MLLDILLALFVAYGFYIGFTRGIINSVFAVVSLIIAVLAAMKLSPIAIMGLEKIWDADPRVLIIVGFVVTFLLVLIAIRLIGRGLEKLFESAKINFVNKIAGGTLLAIVFLITFSWIVWFLNEVRLVGDNTKESSITYALIEPIPRKSQKVISGLRPLFKDFWDKTGKAMDKVRDQSTGESQQDLPELIDQPQESETQ